MSFALPDSALIMGSEPGDVAGEMSRLRRLVFSRPEIEKSFTISGG
jgi:hypothetical protein